MTPKRWAMSVLVALTGIGLVGLIVFRWSWAGDAYSLDVMYSVVPASDDALLQWLRDHATWRNARVIRNANRISIQWDTSEPSSPQTMRQVLGECDRLGYRGRIHYMGTMTNRSQRGTSWHTFWVEYAQMPPDDMGITDWLARQPQVGQPHAWRDGQVIVFQFSTALSSSPTILADILKACEQFGYRVEAGNLSAFGRYGEPMTRPISGFSKEPYPDSRPSDLPR
jgi:hypothetical protein